MSISTFQEKFIKGGCGKAVILFAGVGLIFGMVFSNCSKGPRLGTTDIQGNSQKIFASFGDVDLPVKLIDDAVEQQASQVPPEIFNAMPEYKLQLVAGGISQAISGAQMYELAKEQGFKNDDAFVKQAFHISSEKDFRAFAMDTLRKAGQLKPDSTDKELDDLIKTQAQGKTFTQIYTDQVAGIEKDLKDGEKRLGVVLSAAQRYLKEKLEAGINPTDEDLKKTFEKMIVKRIIVKIDPKVTAEQAKAKADKAYGDLKAGKSFEDTMEAYSEEAPLQGNKKKSENTLPLDASTIDRNPDLKVVAKLQPGSYSEPEKVSEGYAIYKYIEKKLELPKDFEKNKANIKMQVLNDEIQKKFKTSLEDLEKKMQPKFEIKTYEAVYRYAKAMTKPAGPEQEKEFRAVYDLAKSVSASDDKPDLAAMVEVESIKHLYDLPGADKVKLKPERIATLEKFLTFFDNIGYRKEVVDNYKELKQGDKAFEVLEAGMEKNMTKFDQLGQSSFSDLSAKFLELKNANLIKPDQEKKFRSQQETWNIDKKKYDEEQAKLKKQQEEDAKKAAAEAKKAEAEKKNQKPSNDSNLAPKK